MNINRNNYETYFLMYIDNELNASEREAVELFVQQNQDLKPELEILQQTILTPEPVIGFDKTSLYKVENAGINISNYEAYFVMYVDNELTAEERKNVETFVLQHPALQNEFTAFKETVLEKETIEFVNKEVLYRRETKVIAFEWKRLSIAAALLGIIATGIWFYPSDNKNNVVAKTVPQQKNESAAKENNATQSTTTNVDNNTIAVTGNTTIPSIKKQNVADNNSLANNAVTKELKERNTINTVIENDPTKAIAYQQVDVINKETGTTEKIKTGTIEDKGVIITQPVPGELNFIPTSEAVAYKALEEETTNDNVGIGPLSVNKDKLKGIFRKAGRFLTSKTKPENEDGKLQVANFEIDTRKLK
jgi:hypothetical protein